MEVISDTIHSTLSMQKCVCSYKLLWGKYLHTSKTFLHKLRTVDFVSHHLYWTALGQDLLIPRRMFKANTTGFNVCMGTWQTWKIAVCVKRWSEEAENTSYNHPLIPRRQYTDIILIVCAVFYSLQSRTVSWNVK